MTKRPIQIDDSSTFIKRNSCFVCLERLMHANPERLMCIYPERPMCVYPERPMCVYPERLNGVQNVTPCHVGHLASCGIRWDDPRWSEANSLAHYRPEGWAAIHGFLRLWWSAAAVYCRWCGWELCGDLQQILKNPSKWKGWPLTLKWMAYVSLVKLS